MNVTLEIPRSLRRHAAGQASLQRLPGRTVGEALRTATERYPALHPQVFAGDGRVFGFIGVFLNNRDVRGMAGVDTAVADGDVITVVPAIAGG